MRSAQQAAATRRTRRDRPGLFAPRGEKAVYRALQQSDPQALETTAQDFPEFRVTLLSIAAAIHLRTGATERAVHLFDQLATTSADIRDCQYARKYHVLVPRLELSVKAGGAVTTRVLYDAAGFALAAANFHTAIGNYDRALELFQMYPPRAAARLQAVVVHQQRKDPEAVLAATDGVTNEDDLTAILLVARGAAFRELGRYDAAREVLGQVTRFRSRAPDIRHDAFAERALTHLAQGRRSQARKDAERILADDSTNERAHDILRQLT